MSPTRATTPAAASLSSGPFFLVKFEVLAPVAPASALL
jgi:hypothetical protein